MKGFSVAILLFISNCLLGQFTISGSVKNINSEPLIQATVFLEGTYHAAVTDESGNFTISNIPGGTYSLKSSYVGYKSFQKEVVLNGDMVVDINLGESLAKLEGIEINSTRVDEDAAFTYSNLNRETLEKENLGQDVPFLLRWTPSAVVTSDAGAGIGYTGIRIRGSDPTSINVTINGVPLNDSESQNVFWVNMPDFMTSVDNLQVQRGVGTSTNGPAAFGGTISMNSNKQFQNPYAHVNTSIGSFNSRKLSVNLGTGMLNDKYSVDGRYSVIKSDGYIDRASSDLNSWYFSAARLGEKSSLRLIAFSGKERTYQSWYGSPESLVNGDADELQNHYDRNSWFYSQTDSLNLFNSDRRYNYYLYENQVDDYQQDHYQLHYSLLPTSNFKIKATVHYTRGLGFFEEFNANESYDIYDLPEVIGQNGDPISSGDLVRRRWLDNDFYGMILNTEYRPNENFDIQIGGAYSQYKGDHFGNVVTAEGIPDVNLANRYYDGIGDKTDFNAYAKANYRLGKLNIFGDLQIRQIDYVISGTDNDLTALDLDLDYSFFNPKFGLTYFIADNQNVYGSFAIANKEPIRGDLIDNLDQLPIPETLYNIEAGYRLQKSNFNLEWNNYVMLYDNQLVLTGDVNNSGAFLKQNVGKSSRIGTEISVTTELSKNLFWNINSTFSRNRIEAFVEDFGDVVNEYENTNISFSPSIIAANALLYRFEKGLELELSTKYVGKQYLDNTSNDNRSLPAYTYSNLRVTYDWDPTFLGRVKFNAMVYNLFDAKYSSNGYTYSYSTGESIVTENFLYPQAGIHFMLGMNVEF